MPTSCFFVVFIPLILAFVLLHGFFLSFLFCASNLFWAWHVLARSGHTLIKTGWNAWPYWSTKVSAHMRWEGLNESGRNSLRELWGIITGTLYSNISDVSVCVGECVYVRMFVCVRYMSRKVS